MVLRTDIRTLEGSIAFERRSTGTDLVDDEWGFASKRDGQEIEKWNELRTKRFAKTKKPTR